MTMYRYIVSSDSVISRMESTWYKNLDKNNKIMQQLQSMRSSYNSKYPNGPEPVLQERVENMLLKYNNIKEASVEFKYKDNSLQEFYVYIESMNGDVEKISPGYLDWHSDRHYEWDVRQNDRNRPYSNEVVQVLNSPEVMNILEDDLNLTRMIYESCDTTESYLDENIRSVSGCYFHLFRSLIRQKGKFLIKPDEARNVYYRLTGVSRSEGVIIGYRGDILKFNASGDDFEVKDSFYIAIHEYNYRYYDTFSSLNFIMDGTFPTIVSREEALPQQRLF